MPIFNSLSHNLQQGSRGVFLGYRPFINTVNFNTESVNEGSAVTFTVYTLEVANYDTVHYEVTGISPEDVVGGSAALTGSFQVFNNQSMTNPSFTLVSDYLLEGNETATITFTLQSRKTYSHDITVVDFSRPTLQISTNPNNTTINYFQGSNALFTAQAIPINSGSGNVVYQWQRSINLGETWSNLINNSQFSNTNASSLAVNNWVVDLSSNFHNAYFRCILTDGDNGYTITTTAASLTVANTPYGAVTFTTPGTVGWTVPANVYAISAVLVGGGGGGGISRLNPNAPDARVGSGGCGGGLLATPIIRVTPGETISVTTAAAGNGAVWNDWSNIVNAYAGGTSLLVFSNNAPAAGQLRATGGAPGTQFKWESYVNGQWNYPKPGVVYTASVGNGGTANIDSTITTYRFIGTPLTGIGGRGGVGQTKGTSFRYTTSDSRGGGGAGGYGGAGGSASYAASVGNGGGSSFGGGGGGSGSGSNTTSANGAPVTSNNAGGGVSIYGIGSNGAGGIYSSSPSGKGGSAGANGDINGGGLYGGGGQARQNDIGYATGGRGAQGAVRIVFGVAPNGNVRSYAANNDTANTANTTIY